MFVYGNKNQHVVKIILECYLLVLNMPIIEVIRLEWVPNIIVYYFENTIYKSTVIKILDRSLAIDDIKFQKQFVNESLRELLPLILK